MVVRFLNILKATITTSASGRITNERDPDKFNTMNSELYKEASYYANLELKSGAGFAEIKSAYKELIKKYHPDKFNQDEGQRKIAEEITRKLNEAYIYFEKKYSKDVK